jgi:hypothetical protein
MTNYDHHGGASSSFEARIEPLSLTISFHFYIACAPKVDFRCDRSRAPSDSDCGCGIVVLKSRPGCARLM